MQDMSNMSSFQMIIDVTAKIVTRMAKLMRGLESNPQKLTVRELLKGKVYTIKSTVTKEELNIEFDIEVVQIQDILE